MGDTEMTHPLMAWLKKNGMSVKDFAGVVGCSGSHLRRIMIDDKHPDYRCPSRALMRSIAFATNGEVSPNDFVFPDGIKLKGEDFRRVAA